MLRGIGSVFSFLTIFPSSGGTLEGTARHMYAFPAVGIVIGLLVGSLGFGLSFLLDPMLVSLLAVTSLAIVTGIHHTDGLADFADGLMAKGAREKKIRAMRDVSTGSAGTVGLVLYLVGLIAAISLADGWDLLRAVLISEVLAKFSMVLMAGLGTPAVPGSSSPFVRAMGDRRQLAAASAVMIVPTVLVGGTAGLVMLGTTIAVTLFLLGISARSFGGITGDVLGATNELSRLASMVVFVSI